MLSDAPVCVIDREVGAVGKLRIAGLDYAKNRSLRAFELGQCYRHLVAVDDSRDESSTAAREGLSFTTGYFFFGFTACLSVAPAENFGAFDALILTRSPVRGFTPWRAARLTTENLPKPVMMTSSPFFNVRLTVSSSDSIARDESALERPLSEATASISWDLFMWRFLSSRCDRRAGRVPCQLLRGIEQPLGSNARLISSCSSTARSLRWRGGIYSGLVAICAVLAGSESSLRPSRG